MRSRPQSRGIVDRDRARHSNTSHNAGQYQAAHLYSNMRVQEEKPSKKQLKLSCHPVKEGGWAQTPARASTSRVPALQRSRQPIHTTVTFSVQGLGETVQGGEGAGEPWRVAGKGEPWEQEPCGEQHEGWERIAE